ncbi:MAG: hypothetical protein QXF35_00115 [Candidatus Bilamarchaeaceae archaeon]
MDDNNKDKIYKSNAHASNNSGINYEIERDIQANLDKFRDPIILGELVYKLLEERENTNRILKNLLAKIEALEQKLESKEINEEELLVPEIDEKIIEFVKQRQRVTAEDVRVQFGYKGKNAASSRLNRLCDMGILKKKQVGKKVFFFL